MNKLAVAGLIVVLAVAALIALPLSREGFWCDEALSIAIARDAFPVAFFHDVRVAESTPPLFNLLLAGWGRAFGWQEAPIKTYALSWGLLSVAGIAAAGWELAGPIAGLLAGALALHSPLITSHLIETRSYAMSVALLLSGIAALWRGAEKDRLAHLKIAAILLALACWSHYVAFVSVAGCCAFSIAIAWWKREAFWRRVALVNAVAAAAILPLIPLIATQVHSGLPHEPQRSAANRLLLAAQKISFAMPRSNFAPPRISAILLVIAAIAPIFFIRAIPDALRSRVRACVFAAFYAIPVFAVFGPFGSAERYVVLGAAAVCVLFAILITAIGQAASGSAAIAFRAALVCYFALSIGNVVRQAPGMIAGATWSKSGARSFAAATHLQNGDLILAAPEVLAETIAYYAPRPLIYGFTIWQRPEIPDVSQQRVLWSNAVEVVPQTVERLDAVMRAQHPSRVFFVSGRIGAGDPLYLDPRIRALMQALQTRWPLGPPVTFPGRVESLVVWRIR
jgi:4-amino-4-deoxy-L-arabinose transferase-like glycosyltransferase